LIAAMCRSSTLDVRRAPSEHHLTMPDGDAPPVIEVVTGDLACARCEYNLRTLRRDARCPECGTAVAESWSNLSDKVARLSSEALGWIQAGLIGFALAPLLLCVYPFVALVARLLMLRGELKLHFAFKDSSHSVLRESADATADSGVMAIVLGTAAWLVAILLLYVDAPTWFLVAAWAAEFPAFVNNLGVIRTCRELARIDQSPGSREGFQVAGRMLMCGVVATAVWTVAAMERLSESIAVVKEAWVPVGLFGAAALLTIEVAVIVQAVFTARLRRRLQRGADRNRAASGPGREPVG